MRAATRTFVLVTVSAIALTLAAFRSSEAQGDGGYRLVANWPKLPPGMYCGLKDIPPPPAEREAQAAARRARAAGEWQAGRIPAG